MQFTECGDLLSANINFVGKRVYLLVEKCDEPKKDIVEKVRLAKTGWPTNEKKLRRFLNTETKMFEPRPSFLSSNIIVSGLLFNLTHTEQGPSKKTTCIQFSCLVPFDHGSVDEAENPLTHDVIYNISFPFKGNSIVWQKPSLDLDSDTNAFS